MHKIKEQFEQDLENQLTDSKRQAGYLQWEWDQAKEALIDLVEELEQYNGVAQHDKAGVYGPDTALGRAKALIKEAGL